MKKLCVAYLAVFLLTLHLSSQVVRAQNATNDSMPTGTMPAGTMPTMVSNYSTMSPSNGSDRTGGVTLAVLLLPLALAASLLHGRS